MQTSPRSPVLRALPSSPRIEISTPWPRPTEPGECSPFSGSGFDVIWCEASVMAYASRTGALNAFSSAWKTVGDSDDEHERMKRISGTGEGCGEERRIECIVGTAVYH